MRATRDRRVNDPTYIEWQRAYQAEQDAATAAALDADPVAKAERAMDAAAQATLDVIKTGYIPDALLPVERRNGRAIVQEAAVISNFKYFATTTGSFQNWMAGQLWDAAERSQIVPTAPSYLALHNLMLTYSAYEQPVQPAITETEVAAEPMWSPSEQAAKNSRDRLNNIVVVDTDGKEYTEFMLSKLNSVDERRLRRIIEKGHAGNQNYDSYLEVRDAQFARDQKIAQLAAEEEQR